ncbi:MAG: T9SS type A sorting domain-containing protein [Saprospiraceae bacterium]|nr:T9SS type A sorting domain-containing protein [Saprospiraceae bacterium]
MDTCIDISRRGEIPNALHGYGRIDALAAVRAALELTPVSDQNRHDELNVFPNPVHSIVYFQFDDKSVEKSRLRVFNTVGQMILEQIFYSSEIEVRLDQLSAGLYFYEVSREQIFSSGLLLKK